MRAEIERLTRSHGLDGYPRAVLFSARCFAQRGARVGELPFVTHCYRRPRCARATRSTARASSRRPA